MKQAWEYKVVSLENKQEDLLNELGNEGWELVAVATDRNLLMFVAYMKRPCWVERPKRKYEKEPYSPDFDNA